MRGFLSLVLILAITTAIAQPFQPYPERYRRLVQSISFSPDGNTLYFALPYTEYREAQGLEVTDGTPFLVIYQASKEGDGWGEPKTLPFVGKYKEYEPSLSPDGKFMFFNSNRPIRGDSTLDNNSIWYSENVDGVWREPKWVEGINTEEYEESYATITSDGMLYFTAGREVEGEMIYEVHSAKFNEGVATDMKNVKEINDRPGSGDSWVAPDGSYLIYTKFDDENWRETCDLHISFKMGEKWSEPLPIEELNGEGPDFAVAITPDEEWIYYRKNYQFTRVPFQPILEKARARAGG